MSHRTKIGQVGFFGIASLFVLGFFVATAHAQQPNLQDQIKNQLQAGAQGADINAATVADPRTLVALYVQAFLGFIGTIFLVLLVLSGYWLITAHGEEDKAEKATKTIRGAVIGLFVVLIAYSITVFVGRSLQQVTDQIPQQRQVEMGWSERFNRCGAGALKGVVPLWEAFGGDACRYKTIDE